MATFSAAGHRCRITGTKLYCMVTQARVCKQLPSSGADAGVKLASSRVASQRLNYYTTGPYTSCNRRTMNLRMMVWLMIMMMMMMMMRLRSCLAAVVQNNSQRQIYVTRAIARARSRKVSYAGVHLLLAQFLARDVMMSVSVCLSVCLWRLCIMVTGCNGSGYLCMLG